jgi:hypothetical protein
MPDTCSTLQCWAGAASPDVTNPVLPPFHETHFL